MVYIVYIVFIVYILYAPELHWRMLNNGVDIFVASKRLGHAKPSITLDVYGHLLSSSQNEVAEKMEILIK